MTMTLERIAEIEALYSKEILELCALAKSALSTSRVKALKWTDRRVFGSRKICGVSPFGEWCSIMADELSDTGIEMLKAEHQASYEARILSQIIDTPTLEPVMKGKRTALVERLRWMDPAFPARYEASAWAQLVNDIEAALSIAPPTVAESATVPALPADVIELVTAARIVACEDQSHNALRALDRAAEAFAERVPWDDDPNDEPASTPVTPGLDPGAQLRRIALEDIRAERSRQIGSEGWTVEHDDMHDKGQMARAAACYALLSASRRLPEALRHSMVTTIRWIWPWSQDWWKPKNGRRDLVRAGALIVAEIERLDRAANRASLAAFRIKGECNCTNCLTIRRERSEQKVTRP